MTDYLEELLSRLSWPQEEEQEAGWQSLPAISLPAWRWDGAEIPEADGAGQPDGAGPSQLPGLEESDGLSPDWLMEARALSAGNGEGDAPARGGTWEALAGEERTWSETLDQDSPVNDGAGTQTGAEEDAEAAQQALTDQIQSRRRPALLERALQLERTVGRAGDLIAQRQGGARSVSLAVPGRPGALGEGAMDSGRAESGMGSVGAGEGLSHTDQARLVDQAFQRDSRRYDRGFSLY